MRGEGERGVGERGEGKGIFLYRGLITNTIHTYSVT